MKIGSYMLFFSYFDFQLFAAEAAVSRPSRHCVEASHVCMEEYGVGLDEDTGMRREPKGRDFESSEKFGDLKRGKAVGLGKLTVQINFDVLNQN